MGVQLIRIETRMKILVFLFFLISLFVGFGCGRSFQTAGALDGDGSQDQQSDQGSGVPSIPVNLKICSKLDFNQIQWPLAIQEVTQNAFATALNVTSSYEGVQSWATISGDFDQMGLSLGLLQQNLGSQSLQPLLLKMRSTNSSKMKTIFSSAHYNSLNQMLNDWQSGLSPQGEELFPDDETVISLLDRSSAFQVDLLATDPSVLWARQNILQSGVVKADWKKEFQSLAAGPEYKNIQFKEALKLHVKTEAYRKQFGFTSLKSYLFLFDVVVQNGGFQKSHRTKYLNYLKTSSTVSELQKLNKLLEIRLETVREQYKSDVAARKLTILTGKGFVHGKTRDLNKEYCYLQGLILGPVQDLNSQNLQ